MSKLNMKEWINEIIQKKEVVAMPIMTHPGIEMIGKTVRDAVTDGQVHYNAIKALSEKYPTAAATVIMDLTVEAEAFGAEIVFPENEVPSVVGRLLANEEDIEKLNIPALNKGQFAFVPVNIFLQKITDAAKDVYPTPDPETIKPEIGQVVDGGSYTNDSPEPVVQELSYTAYVGQTVTNIDEVKTWIDANIPATKALSNEELKAVLKAAVEGLNTGFTAVVRTEEVTIAPYTTVTLKATTNYQTSVNNVSATVDGVVYNIPGVNIKVALNTTATQDIVSITHDHGHGHGNGNNAGGGNGDGTAY